jgi:hypothetical protein
MRLETAISRSLASLGTIGPSAFAFLGSLLLSLIATQKATINRDGMLYVDTARVFLAEGFGAATATFQWPFLSILMAMVSQLTGLGLEASGILLSSLFMAGTCALLVACAARIFPEAIWYVCLVILALPGFNGYRDELLREYGCWFFIMLSLWLALRWSDAPRWPMALAAQASLCLAALFRPEALALFPALILWQIFAAPAAERWQRLAMIGGLPLAGLGMLLVLYATGELSSGRLAADLGRLSLARFDAKAAAMASSFIEYARDQGRTILFFGSLAIIPVKFIGKMSVFLVPLIYAFVRHGARAIFERSQLFAWAFLAHLLVLAVFVLDLQFLAGRYVAPLILFSAPVTGYGCWLLTKRFPAWKIPMILVLALVMAANVITLGPGKYHFVEAGDWLAKNATDTPRVYVESARAAYYAGWRFAARPSPANRPELVEALAQDKYDLVVLEVSRNEPDIAPWLENKGLKAVQRFIHHNGDAVIIVEPQRGHK